MGNAGIFTNFVPKDGGNSFRGTVYGDVTRAPWSMDNLTQRLRDRGITNVTKVYNISDFNPGVGGPIRKDRLWFYAAYRYEALDSSVVDTFYNKSPVWYLYEPDFDRPAHDTGSIPNASIRLTWQASSKDKVTGWFTHQAKQRPYYNVGNGNTPEGGGRQVTHYAQPMVFKLTRPQTNRLLFEGGFAYGRTYFDNGYREDITPSFDRVDDSGHTEVRDHRHRHRQDLRRLDPGSPDVQGEHVGRSGVGELCDRCARAQGRVRGWGGQGAAAQRVQRRHDGDLQRRPAAVGHLENPEGHGRRLLARPAALPPGAVDVQARDVHGRAALRLFRRRGQRRDAAGKPLESVAVLPRLRGPALAGSVAAGRRRVRPVWQRADGAQGDRSPLRRPGRL